MESALPSVSESSLGEVDNSVISVGVGAKAEKRKPQSKYTMKIVNRSQNMLNTMDQIKQQDVSKVNIQPSRSR